METRITLIGLFALAALPASAQTAPTKTLTLTATRPAAAPAAAAPAAAVAPPPAAPRLPFQAPVVGPATLDTRFTSGVILSVEPSGKRFVINTASGALTCDLDPASRIIGPDGKPSSPPALRVGGALRLYYTVGQGAHVQEADLLITQ